MTTLAEATAMHINFRKTKILPLHRTLVGRALETLRLHNDDWRLATECTRALYLGVWVGHDARVACYSAIMEKMDARVTKIDYLKLGMPAALGLSRIVMWSVVHCALSLFEPDGQLQQAFNGV